MGCLRVAVAAAAAVVVAAAGPLWRRVGGRRGLWLGRRGFGAGCIDVAAVVASCSFAGHKARLVQGRVAGHLGDSARTCYCRGSVDRADSVWRHIGSSAYSRTPRFGLPVLVVPQRPAVASAAVAC